MPLLPRSNSTKQLLSNPDTFATTLVAILIDQYGTEALTWSPETIRLELHDDFQVQVPQVCIDKIMAAICILTTNDFYKSLPRFIQLCNVLADDTFNPLVFDPADSFEMAWAITEAMLLSPPEEDEPFTEEIRFYIGHMLTEEGVVNPPDVLRIAIQDVTIEDPLAGDTEDPAMYAAFYESQRSKSAEISAMLKRQIDELFAELQALDLRNGNTGDLLSRMQKTSLAD
jgi:hypothetical protein